MNLAPSARKILFAALLALFSTDVLAQAPQATPAARSGQNVRVVGIVRDETNAIALPGMPVEVVDTKEAVYTDVDGSTCRSSARQPRDQSGHRGLSGKVIKIETGAARTVTVDIGLAMIGFAESVTVTARRSTSRPPRPRRS